MPLLTDVGDRLISAAIVTARGTDLFEGKMPEGQQAQDAIVVMRETIAGEQAEMTFGSGVARTQFPRLQIWARGAKGDHDTPRNKLQAIADNLIQVQAVTLGTTLYQMIHHFNGPAFVDLDDDNLERPLYVANFRVEKDPG